MRAILRHRIAAQPARHSGAATTAGVIGSAHRIPGQSWMFFADATGVIASRASAHENTASAMPLQIR